MVDLYKELGVKSRATSDDIKQAYRKKVKALHPDAGGDSHTFARVAAVYRVLSDPDKRKKYDETGWADFEMVSEEERVNRAAVGNVMSLFNKMLSTPIEQLIYNDMEEVLVRWCEETIDQIEQATDKDKDTLDRLAKIEKRMKYTGEETDLFTSFAASVRSKIDDGTKNRAFALKTWKRSLKLIKDYKWEGEAMRPRWVSAGGNASTTMGGFW